MSGVPRREAPLLILSFRTDVGPLLVRERSRGSATDRILKPVASDDGRKPNVCTGGHLTGTPFRVEGFGCDLAVSHAPDVSLPWGVLEAGLSFWCVPSRQPPANLRDQSLHHRTRRSVVTGLTAGPRSGAQAPPARHGRDGSPPAAPNLAHRQHTRHGGGRCVMCGSPRAPEQSVRCVRAKDQVGDRQRRSRTPCAATISSRPCARMRVGQHALAPGGRDRHTG